MRLILLRLGRANWRGCLASADGKRLALLSLQRRVPAAGHFRARSGPAIEPLTRLCEGKRARSGPLPGQKRASKTILSLL